jgi:hypothetical protein
MVSVYCKDALYVERARRALDGSGAARIVDDWDAFEAVAACAVCSVVVIPWLSGDAALKRLALFRGLHPLHPVVLVTRGDIQNARDLKAVVVDEVVWTQEIDRELSDAVGRTCVLSQTRRMAADLRANRALPTKLREALARACESERPIRTVHKLAAGVGCDRRTLWTQWKQVMKDGGADLRLQDFLHWLVLLRATGRKTASRPWAAVAQEVGVHPDTLGRLAQQLTGCSLRDLCAGGQGAVAAKFEKGVLACLPGGAPDKAPEIGQSAVGGRRRVA